MTASRGGLMAAGLAGGMAAPAALRAQGAWPGERPIQIIVPSRPGGGTDVNIRAMGPFFEKHLPGVRFIAVKRYGTPEDVGAAVAFLCSGDNAFVTGQVLNVDGGFASSGVMYDPAEGA